jgi:hypothetical protein
MRIQPLAAAAFSVLLMSAGAAHATTYTIDESYTVTACTSSGCVTTPAVPFSSTNKAPTFNGGGDPSPLGQNIALPTGVQNFFTADPASSAGNSSGLVQGTIQVDFTFKEINSMGATIGTGSLVQDGTYQANYNGSLSCSSSTGKSDCLYWNPLGEYLKSLSPPHPGDGSTYGGTGDSNHQSTTASVTDLVTLSNGAYFDVSFFDAQDWNITPGVSFTNIDPNPTPLPATLPLFVGGLGFVGLLVRRKKKQQASI